MAEPTETDGQSDPSGEYTLGALEQAGVRSQEPRDSLRQELLDLARAPSGEVDPAAHAWTELSPGIRVVELHQDPARSMRGCLVWAAPLARTPAHRHLGDEVILVLSGALRDEHGSYHAGQICRSRTGSVHTEEVLPGEDCFCYVVYYGEHELA